jgi:hypothetical protein
MSPDIEELLRDRMDTFTAHAPVPIHLAAKAIRHRRRHRSAVGALVGVGVAVVVGAATLAGVSAGSARPGPPRIQTVAYVVSRVKASLVTAAPDRVEYARTVFSSPPSSIYGDGAWWPVKAVESWTYDGRTRNLWFSPAGRPTVEALIDRSRGIAVQVNYTSRTWWRLPSPRHPVLGRVFRCNAGIGVSLGAPDLRSATQWVTYLRAMLGCGGLRIAGRQRVDGIDAIKIVLGPASNAGGQQAVWVQPSTYLPVRMRVEIGPRGDPQWQVTSFRWLTPGKTSLANLTVSVPTGFKQVQPPRLIRLSINEP